MAPTAAQTSQTTPPPALRTLTMPTPIGDLTLSATPAGITAIDFGAAVPACAKTQDEPWPVLERCRAQIFDYFAGRRQRFDVPVDLPEAASDFARRAWAGLADVPFGHTWSYSQLAAHIGQPTAVRAVATACARNPVPLLLPCHRIVRADGSLGKYRGGENAKALLVEHERRMREPLVCKQQSKEV